MKGMEGLGSGPGSKEIAQNSAVAIVRGLAHSSRRERVRLSQSEREREEQFRKFCETERGFETNEDYRKIACVCTCQREVEAKSVQEL